MRGAGDGWHDRGERRDEVRRLSDVKARGREIPYAETVGPQGSALIAELQRIQRAFDQEHLPHRPVPQAERSSDENGRAATSHPRHRPRTARRGMISRAFNACLKRFGVADRPPVGRTTPVANHQRPQTAHRPWPSQAADRSVPPPHVSNVRPLPLRPAAAMNVGSPPPLELRERRLEPAESGLAREIPRAQEHRIPGRRAAVPAETKASGGVVATCIGHARTGCAYLLGRDGGLADHANGAELVTRVRRSFERELRTGLRVLLVGVVLIGGWAALVPLSSAVVATGSLVVQSNVKKVQHPTGGVVAQIAAHDGMHVNAGDLLVRLDATQARANLEMVAKELDEVRIRIARLSAERDGLDEPKMPPELAERSADEEVGARFASEKSLFVARATARKSQKDLLQSRIAQLGQQIDGLGAQIKSNASQVDLIAGELQGVQTLFAKGLAPVTRVNSLQRDLARLHGERGQFQASIAETESKIGEAKLQIIRVDQDFRADVIKDLREAEGKEAELAERQVAARDVLDRVEIRAPTAGIVHELAIHTVGGVIKAGDVVMEIVPDAGDLQVEARLSPSDIDQVKVEQATSIRFSAFSQRTTPQLSGVVSYVSADITHDQQSNISYYTVRVTLPEEEHRRLAGLQLISGMPVEIFVQTGSRTMMSYLFKPITDQLRRAFIER
jgi:HlyD family secretion protein